MQNSSIVSVEVGKARVVCWKAIYEYGMRSKKAANANFDVWFERG